MKVLVVGGGGREHALCWALAASPMVTELFCAPGNPGIAAEATCVPLAVDDLDGIERFAVDNGIGLVVIGPELPLVLGLADRLAAAGIRAFGPDRAAARLEGSKSFMKAFCERHGIPTAAHGSFGQAEQEAARAYLAAQPVPVVIKADGLAAGKGVVIATTRAEAEAALADAFAGRLGDTGERVVIEAFLDGVEASLFAICDGTTALEIGTAQDHKRAHDGDEGSNTGGMGAYSPAPILDEAMVERVMREIVRPTVQGMAAEGTPFRGILYAGLMIDEAGPKLLEYNVRFGDPECQVIMPRLMTDICQLMVGATDGMLEHMNLRWLDQHALTVVMAAKGYPGAYEKGTRIDGLDALKDEPDVLVFHAGTKRENDAWLAAGGRVLGVTGLGASLAEARDRAYGAVDRIDWPGGFCRRDIGWRVLGRPDGDG